MDRAIYRNLIFFILLLISFQHLQAQNDNDANMHLVYDYMYSKEADKLKELAESRFLNTKDITKQIMGNVCMINYYSLINDEKGFAKYAEKAVELASQTKKELDRAYAELGLAIYYSEVKKDDLFTQYVNKSINTLSKYNYENLSLTYLYYLKDRYKVKNTFERDTFINNFKANQNAIKSRNNVLINLTYIMIGNNYRNKFEITKNKKYLDSANTNYNYALQYAKLIKYLPSRKSAELMYYGSYGKIASYMFKDDTESMKAYNHILQTCKDDSRFNNVTALIRNNIGSIFLKQGKYVLAEQQFTQSYQLSKSDDRIEIPKKISILENLSKVYEMLDQPQKALTYERLAKELMRENYQKQFDSKAKSIEIFYETEQKNQHIKQLEEKNSIYNKQRLMYIGIILFSFTGIIFIAYILHYKQKINKQRNNLLIAERIETNLKLQLEQEEKSKLKIEQELLVIKQEQMQKQALAKSLQLDHKNTFINNLKDKIKQRKHINIDKIIKEELFADKDFSTVQNIVQEVHPNFFKRLNEISKRKLSSQDLRYASFIYLNMDNQQISTILKMDSNTVRTTKYRLKQKLGLCKDTDLAVFLKNLEL